MTKDIRCISGGVAIHLKQVFSTVDKSCTFSSWGYISIFKENISLSFRVTIGPQLSSQGSTNAYQTWNESLFNIGSSPLFFQLAFWGSCLPSLENHLFPGSKEYSEPVGERFLIQARSLITANVWLKCCTQFFTFTSWSTYMSPTPTVAWNGHLYTIS